MGLFDKGLIQLYYTEQVQDETQKMNAWFARQESGLSQSVDCLDKTNNAVESYRMDRVPKWGSSNQQSEMTEEKSNTLPFTHRRKHTNVDSQLRGRAEDRRKASLGN